MSEVLKKSDSQTTTSIQSKWSPLQWGLAFLAATERFTTPVFAAMATSATLVALALTFTISRGAMVWAMPLAIVTAAIDGGAVMKWWMRRATKQRRRRRR